jgi:hypothetical protein
MNKSLAIGTVAGLIGFAATAPAAVVVSPINNQPLNATVNDLDLDGNGTTDFQVSYFNLSDALLVGQTPTNLVASINLDTQVRVYSFNDPITATDPTVQSISITNLVGAGECYVGVNFLHGELQQVAWLRFNYPTATPTDGLLVAAAWQDVAGDPIRAGEVPEPAGLLLCLSGAAAWSTGRRWRMGHATGTR